MAFNAVQNRFSISKFCTSKHKHLHSVVIQLHSFYDVHFIQAFKLIPVLDSLQFAWDSYRSCESSCLCKCNGKKLRLLFIFPFAKKLTVAKADASERFESKILQIFQGADRSFLSCSSTPFGTSTRYGTADEELQPEARVLHGIR